MPWFATPGHAVLVRYRMVRTGRDAFPARVTATVFNEYRLAGFDAYHSPRLACLAGQAWIAGLADQPVHFQVHTGVTPS